ncbi:hypothetical protein [Streptomyces celluloflavus]|uniref:hypothetical protein n=1 Tax=Streptomyces celluloflavus TaxID=58344 RepID=UPI0034612218|nr:hypothetical protein OG717_30025 [Streptomyces celluloflavus]
MTHPTAMPLAAAAFEPSPLLAIVALLAVALPLTGRLIRRGRARTGGARSGAPAVRVAALAATACTAYTADTSWRFAADYLDMGSTVERAFMFAIAELALFATALLARQNLHGPRRASGLPGTLVWVITAVQVIPAYAESGPVGGTVRAFVGPIMAAMLWHQAMGIELRLRKPEAASHGVLATLGREVRERMLSRLGVAERDRDAAQITRDRATAQAVALAARLAERSPKRRENWRGRRIAHRLSKAVARACVGTDLQQRDDLLDQLAARRHATALATLDLSSPWTGSTRDQEQDGGDRPALHLLVADHLTVGDQPRRLLRTVPDAGPEAGGSPVGDRPEGDHAGPGTGTEPHESRDRPHPVPTNRDQTSAGDRADTEGSSLAAGTDQAANGDQHSAVPGTDKAGDHADGSADRAHETAAQDATPPSPTPVPRDGDQDGSVPEAGTEPHESRDRPHTVPPNRDRTSAGDRADTEGSNLAAGTDAAADGDHDSSVPGTDEAGERPRPVPMAKAKGTGDGGPYRGDPDQQSGSKLSEDELVALVGPHIPAALERDGNGAVTRVQLRKILRAQNIPIRNDRLTPVLQRLRSETGTTAKRSSTR